MRMLAGIAGLMGLLSVAGTAWASVCPGPDMRPAILFTGALLGGAAAACLLLNRRWLCAAVRRPEAAAPLDGQGRDRSANGEARYRLLVEQIPDALLVFKNKRLVYANRSAFAIFRAATLEELGAAAWPGNESCVGEWCRAPVGDSGTGGRFFWEREWHRKNGEKFMGEWAFSVVDFDGETALQILIKDVSERYEAETESRLLREFTFRMRVENSKILLENTVKKIT